MQQQLVPLKSTCPSGCVCRGKDVKNWTHSSCKTQSYINCKGDISCDRGCATYFIQHAGFKCEQAQNYESFKTATQFLMALAQAMQAAEFNLSDDDLLSKDGLDDHDYDYYHQPYGHHSF
ncbi:hypothetical protein pb186bvf_016038 [Paramecium bursaria]